VIDELIGAELNKACEKLEISCYCCDSKEHLVMDCPDFLKQADKLFFICNYYIYLIYLVYLLFNNLNSIQNII